MNHSVTFYAENLHVSPKYLGEGIKNVTGKSPKAWIDELLLNETKCLLKQTQLSIKEIVWTEDTYFDYVGTIYDSCDAVYGYAKEHMVSDEAKGKRHFAQNIRITAVQDDKVHMKSNFKMLKTDEIPFIVATGAIEEEVVKTPDG